MMYLVVKYQFSKNCEFGGGFRPVYVEGFDSMEKAMEFTKEEIRHAIIDYGYETGGFCMLDSADDESISYPYYSFEVAEDDMHFKYRFDVIKFSEGNRVYL